MPNGLDKLAEGMGKAIETVPAVYDDGLKPAIQESGKILALIPRTINAALVPLRQWIDEREYNLDETKKLLAQKLEHIDEEKIVTPEAYVAVPAIQAISYSMNSEELRNLYANLLAKSMITDTKEFVHPSFVEIIKQMSPTDAQVFRLIMNSPLRPLINLQKSGKAGGMQHIQDHCSWITELSIKQCATSIDSLIRLGLIEIPFGESYTNKTIYNSVRKNPFFKELEQQYIPHLNTNEKLQYDEQYIKATDLSKLFYKICVLNP
jgi:hypothetical protein